MNVSKLRSSTAVATALEITAASAVAKKSTKPNDGSLEAHPDKAPHGAPSVDLTTDNVNTYLQEMSANSCDRIDSLIGGLNGLRERLVTDGDRLKRDIVEFDGLNRSVVELTRIVSDGVVHVVAPTSEVEAN